MPSRSLPSRTDAYARRARLTTGGLGLLLVAVMLGFCVLTVSMMTAMHSQIWADTERTSQNLLEAEVAGIDRILTIYDASLRFAADTLRNPLVREAAPAVQRLAMYDGAQQVPGLGPVRILDGQGFVVYDSSTSTPDAASGPEQRALFAARSSLGHAVAISAPFAGGHNAFAVTVSHRMTTADGAFAGIVIGTIDLDIFQREFGKLHVGAHDVVTLFSNDGVILAHIPGDPLVGRSIAGSDILRRFLHEGAGTFEAPAAIDGIRRVFSFRHVARWPLFVDVGLSAQDLYRPWQHRVEVIGVLMGVLLGFTVVMLRFLRRDLRARLEAERSVVAIEGRYRLLAASASDVIVRVDRSTIRTYVSPSCRQYGYEPEELLGLPSSSWVHHDDLARARAVFLKTIDEQVDAVIAYRLRHKNGEYTWVESHLSHIQQGGYLAAIRKIEGELPTIMERVLEEA